MIYVKKILLRKEIHKTYQINRDEYQLEIQSTKLCFCCGQIKINKKTKVLQKSLPCAHMIRTAKIDLCRAFHMRRTTKANVR
jgi:hypothetical protein